MTDSEQLDAVRRLLHLADTYALSELEVEHAGLKVTIRGGGSAATAAPTASPRPATPPEPQRPDDSHYHTVASPMTGVFYRSATPEAPPFIEVGDRVEEGATVGLIEAMKVFSEIPADRSGSVIRILAPTGKLVSQGDALMLLDPLS